MASLVSPAHRELSPKYPQKKKEKEEAKRDEERTTTSTKKTNSSQNVKTVNMMKKTKKRRQDDVPLNPTTNGATSIFVQQFAGTNLIKSRPRILEVKHNKNTEKWLCVVNKLILIRLIFEPRKTVLPTSPGTCFKTFF